MIELSLSEAMADRLERARKQPVSETGWDI